MLYVHKTGGYCWPTSFKVLGVLFLGEVSLAFWPSKKACWAHQFQYLGVGQQYPLIFEIADVLIKPGGIVWRTPWRQCSRQAPPRSVPISFRIYSTAVGANTYGNRTPPGRTSCAPRW